MIQPHRAGVSIETKKLFNTAAVLHESTRVSVRVRAECHVISVSSTISSTSGAGLSTTDEYDVVHVYVYTRTQLP